MTKVIKKVERTLLAAEKRIAGESKDFRTLVKSITGASDEVVEKFLLEFDSSRINTTCLLDLFDFGFTKRQSEKLLTALQFAVRLTQMSTPDLYIIRSPHDLYEIVRYLKFYEQEVFLVVALDTKNRVIAKKEIFVGTLSSSIVHPREVFGFAIQHSAASILVAHQHRRMDMFLFY